MSTTIRDLFEKWMGSEFGEDSDWDEGWNRANVFQAFEAGRKSRNKKRSQNKNNPYKFSSSAICSEGEDFHNV